MFDFSSCQRIAFTARAVRQGDVGFITFIEEVPALMAWGASREEAECNLKRRFAAFVAEQRNLGNLRKELTVIWM
jgi:hypothetical protein